MPWIPPHLSLGKPNARSPPLQTCDSYTSMMSTTLSNPKPRPYLYLDILVLISRKRPGSAEPVGGYPRFQYLVNQYRDSPEYKSQPDLISLFSGDAFNPSLEGSVTKGKHMLDVLNHLPTRMACIGVSFFVFK